MIITTTVLFSCQEVTTTCTVTAHATSSDKYGYIEYYTVGNCDDGMIRSVSGVKYYSIPVGNKFTYKYNVIK